MAAPAFTAPLPIQFSAPQPVAGGGAHPTTIERRATAPELSAAAVAGAAATPNPHDSPLRALTKEMVAQQVAARDARDEAVERRKSYETSVELLRAKVERARADREAAQRELEAAKARISEGLLAQEGELERERQWTEATRAQAQELLGEYEACKQARGAELREAQDGHAELLSAVAELDQQLAQITCERASLDEQAGAARRERAAHIARLQDQLSRAQAELLDAAAHQGAVTRLLADEERQVESQLSEVHRRLSAGSSAGSSAADDSSSEEESPSPPRARRRHPRGRPLLGPDVSGSESESDEEEPFVETRRRFSSSGGGGAGGAVARMAAALSELRLDVDDAREFEYASLDAAPAAADVDAAVQEAAAALRDRDARRGAVRLRQLLPAVAERKNAAVNALPGARLPTAQRDALEAALDMWRRDALEELLAREAIMAEVAALSIAERFG